MKPGDYRIQVHILEAKDIKSKAGDTADPMVEVSLWHPNLFR
jgi:hypothetical protein